jgi:hypothetical protein
MSWIQHVGSCVKSAATETKSAALRRKSGRIGEALQVCHPGGGATVCSLTSLGLVRLILFRFGMDYSLIHISIHIKK